MVTQILDTSLLKLGPLTFTHQVQKIEIQEVKSVRPIDTLRTNRYFLYDSGEARHVAQIRLLFTGLDEINAGLYDGPDSTSGIRGLIALFKTCPITTIQNKELGICWTYIDDEFVAELKEQEATDLQKSLSTTSSFFDIESISKAIATAPNTKIDRIRNLYSKYIPCTIDSLHVENVPEIPYSLQVTIVVSRTDPTPYFNKKRSFGSLLYQGQKPGEYSPNPDRAYWLENWMEQLLEGSKHFVIPFLEKSDFDAVTLTKWPLDYPDTGGQDSSYGLEKIKLPITTKPDGYYFKTSSAVLAESCTLSNKFSYKKLSGHGWSCPTHMGSTSRSMALDIVFNNQESTEEFEKFCKFKESSDKLAKLKEAERLLRVQGWVLTSPISKLMNIVRFTGNNARFGSNHVAFVPLSIDFDTSDIPNLVNCKVNLIENNPDIFSDSETILQTSGVPEKELKAYFDKITRNQSKFKTEAFIDYASANKDNEPAFRLYWPVGAAGIRIQNSVTASLLNKDTLRAVLVDDPDIKKLLKDDPFVTGVIKSPDQLGGVSQAGYNVRAFIDAIFGSNPSPLFLEAAKRAVERLFPQLDTDAKTAIAELVWPSILGNIEGSPLSPSTVTTATQDIIEILLLDGKRKRSDFVDDLYFNAVQFETNIITFGDPGFNYEVFNDKLFKVITQRKPIPSYLSKAYSSTGIYDAFYILLLSFNSDTDSINPGDITNSFIENLLKEEVANQNLIFGNESLYPDLFLPTYYELYGSDWKKFAPTFGDLGVSVPLKEQEDLPAVTEKNFVSPAAWFFTERKKQDLKSNGKLMKEGIAKAKGKLHISIPFNTSEVERLKEYYRKSDNVELSIETINKFLSGDASDKQKEQFKKEKSVASTIIRGLIRWRNENPSAYEATMVDLATLHDEEINPDDPIKIGIHHNRNKALYKLSDIPGLGKHTFTALNRGLNNLKMDQQDEYAPDEDESTSSLRERDIYWHRNLTKNNNAAIDSSISQVHDDFYSPEKMFPTFKIYLLDKRGDEIVGDSTLFSVNAIKSIDITLDQHDAPLAVIRIADPLFILQNDVFAEGNVNWVTREVVDSKTSRTYEKGEKVVRASLPSNERTRTDYYKRYKLSQGRSIQIRIGYSSVPSALPIVFTGKITEIQNGDELLIVAQGWKAELFSRQVSFYNDKEKSWGPRDLVIQTITEANPDGIGTNYTPDKTKIIGKAVESTLASAMVERVQNNQRNNGIPGSKTVSQQIGDWFASWVNANESEGLKGLDFRLKNIWYQDTKLYNNLFGWRSVFGIMPTTINDSWVIPIQPAWQAIEEATRHTWNTIADVVPYDTESTLFMGHPDQPYFYTEGSKYLNKLNGHFRKLFKKDYVNRVETVLGEFTNSSYYTIDQSQLNTINTFLSSNTSPYQGGETPGSQRLQIRNDLLDGNIDYYKSFLTAANVLQGKIVLVDTNEGLLRIDTLLADQVVKDPTVIEKYRETKQKLGTNKLISFLFRRFFRVSQDTMQGWYTSEQDLEFALRHNGPVSEVLDFNVRQRLESMGSESVGKDNIGRARDELENSIGLIRTDKVIAPDITIYERALRLYNRDPDEYTKPLLQAFQELETFAVENKLYQYSEYTVDNALTYLDTLFGAVSARPRAKVQEEGRKLALKYIKTVNNALTVLEGIRPNVLPESILTGGFLGFGQSVIKDLSIEEQWPYFKCFINFFCNFVADTPSSDTTRLGNIASVAASEFPTPNMKVFRVHHYLSDDLNIICNNLTSTLNEMWNTVIIEHPERGEVDSIVNDESIVTRGKINASANWRYWPSQEVTGVKGLQFHPGLTLSNKKVKVFTELNCQSQDLAAKIACNRLAEGIRKMYRGNICVLGKHIKPHDRLLLADNYTKLTGPVGVESIVHHFNSEDGWITNIKPEAVCDANPSASIMQTAALEATYESVFNIVDFAADAITWAAIIATLGAASPLAAGKSMVFRGALTTVKRAILNPKRLARQVGTGYKRQLRKNLAILSKKGDVKGLRNKISALVAGNSGTVISVAAAQFNLGVVKFGVDMSFKSNVIAAFTEDYSETSGPGVAQLPVILSPVLHNGTPLTSGLELGDHMWQIGAVGTFYSLRQMKEGLINLSDEIIQEIQ